MTQLKKSLTLVLIVTLSSCASYDVIIRNGSVYDGSGEDPVMTDVGIKKDRIDTLGDLHELRARHEIDATGLAVAPGFINTLSWAARALEADGRSMSDIKQGVTLEVFGEGSSPGPYKPSGKDKKGKSLGDQMDHLERKGISCNVASFVGAATVRTYILGRNDVQPDSVQLKQMTGLVRTAMKEGALGVGSSLIYPPGVFATTDELIALSAAAGEFGGIYISHMRSEGDRLSEGVDELIRIASRAGVPAEIYHLKAAGESNWPKLDEVIRKIDSARAQGLQISANMYTYTGASTGLGACVPPWVQEGTDREWIERMRQDSVRKQVIGEMESPRTDWENFLAMAGKPENILLLEFNKPHLQKYVGKNLAEVMVDRGVLSAATMIVDLIIENEGNIAAVYFLMSEENIRKKLQLPYMSFGSDAGSIAAEGGRLKDSTHPRTYGNFARLLGKYVREEHVLSLQEAIRKLTSLPAEKFHLTGRGRIGPGYYADIAVFDPETIRDQATYESPHAYALGMRFVLVNGRVVLQEGQHTGKTPGRFVHGPGYSGKK